LVTTPIVLDAPLEVAELRVLEELLMLFELELVEPPLVLAELEELPPVLPKPAPVLLGAGFGRGAALTRNGCVPLAVPSGVVTVIGPLVAPVGTIASSSVSLSTWKKAVLPLKLTAVVPSKPAPRRVTVVPTGPLGGLKLTRLGDVVAEGVGVGDGAGDEEVLTALRRTIGAAATVLTVLAAVLAAEPAVVVAAALLLLVLAVPPNEIVRALCASVKAKSACTLSVIVAIRAVEVR
jgi:hypothetical protein